MKQWTANELYFREGNQMFSRILKLHHKNRDQHVTIVTTPRIASIQFYKDWVHQPYAKDNQQYTALDLFHPFANWIIRPLRNRGKFGQHTYFNPAGMPEAMSMGLSRLEHLRRSSFIAPPLRYPIFTTHAFRDKHHAWLPKRLRNIMGDTNLAKPSERDRSIVFLLPPYYAETTIRFLSEIGFKQNDVVDVACGDADTLTTMSKYADWAHLIATTYLWILLILAVNGIFRIIHKEWVKYVREQITLAGRSPEDFGY
jgi:hypothetical protein